jgi:N-acetylglucosaminyldiphosphoundecaprenol N-acetyl-beta-D-mannosaminyltransferase
MKKVKILSMMVDVVTITSAIERIFELVKAKKGSYICVSNVHMCMETYDDIDFRAVVNNADIVVPDGRPIFFAQKLLGNEVTEQVRGQDLVEAICKASNSSNLNIGLYGGANPSILRQVQIKLTESYPDIKISFMHSPPFRKLTDMETTIVLNEISDAKVDVLFVGIGCPKQEKWMAENYSGSNCVMLGVGAAFDFIAGNKAHAPRWMQKVALEWFFRLCTEPRRLWKRYLLHNPRFMLYFLFQYIKMKLI